MIFPCRCKNEYQDRRYGQGRRVGNIAVNALSADRKIVLRCSSCCGLYHTNVHNKNQQTVGERKTRFWHEDAESVSERFVFLCRYKRN